MEDDVIVEFIFNQLEAKDPDPRKMQISLTGFLNGKNARIFMGELWELLDSAQKTTTGIPQELIDKKKEEMKSKSDDDRIRTNLKKLGMYINSIFDLNYIFLTFISNQLFVYTFNS